MESTDVEGVTNGDKIMIFVFNGTGNMVPLVDVR